MAFDGGLGGEFGEVVEWSARVDALPDSAVETRRLQENWESRFDEGW